jgi:uncharacterized protein (TIGR03437 family)
MRFLRTAILLLILAISVTGQAPPQFWSLGYSPAELPTVAPGQLVTIYVQGLGGSLAYSNTLPLPRVLGGITVQAVDRVGLVNASLPILAVQPLDCAGGNFPPCGLTAVTVQMPTDLPACMPFIGIDQGPCVHSLLITVKSGNMAVQQQEFIVVPAVVHVLKSCDTVISAIYTPPQILLGSCFPLITKLDGSVVSGVKPAHTGTTIVLYAFGLGLTNVKIPTGSASPAGAKIAPEIVNISYDPDIEAPPRIGPALPDHPVYVGLVAGYTGLYQINVRLPDRFPFPLQDCGGTQGGINLTVSIAAGQPPEATRICVAP